jgi:hypothetical protein
MRREWTISPKTQVEAALLPRYLDSGVSLYSRLMLQGSLAEKVNATVATASEAMYLDQTRTLQVDVDFSIHTIYSAQLLKVTPSR